MRAVENRNPRPPIPTSEYPSHQGLRPSQRFPGAPPSLTEATPSMAEATPTCADVPPSVDSAASPLSSAAAVSLGYRHHQPTHATSARGNHITC